MKDDERRSILRSLTDEEYLDVMEVCASMPYVTLEIKSEGKKLLDIYIYIYLNGFDGCAKSGTDKLEFKFQLNLLCSLSTKIALRKAGIYFFSVFPPHLWVK